MEKREFKELIQEAVQSSGFSAAVILRTIGFALSVISGFLTVPYSMNAVGSIIGTLIGGIFTLFLTVLPLFEILRAKNSQNFKNDCDFGLKYLRINTIITLVVSVLFAIVSLLVMVAVDFRFVFLVLLSGALLAYAILQLEIINDLRNGLFYNIEKISYTGIYFVLTVLFCVISFVLFIASNQLLDAAVSIINSVSQIIIAYLIMIANKKWIKGM